MNAPTKDQIVKLRETYQSAFNIKSIRQAQEECAELIHSSYGAWRKWEDGDRHMHPGLWELATLKVSNTITASNPEATLERLARRKEPA
ncbi:MAG: hypothetical protein CMI01_15545 [Oceanospirillaceae bacterium]|nr:hypothetical protein [Oceanospirillaceae bacterium]